MREGEAMTHDDVMQMVGAGEDAHSEAVDACSMLELALEAASDPDELADADELAELADTLRREIEDVAEALADAATALQAV